VIVLDRRYKQPDIEEIWSQINKLRKWEQVELAVIKAREELGEIPEGTYEQITGRLAKHPINESSVKWTNKRDDIIGHDLNAAVDERRRWLPKWLQKYYHEGITSYDTEDNAFVMMLSESLLIVNKCLDGFDLAMLAHVNKYWHCIKGINTHGQLAELGTEGSEKLSWLAELRASRESMDEDYQRLNFGKLGGATSHYHTISPEEEKQTLKILGKKVFYGATQIMPRALYSPLAAILAQIVRQLDKFATDLRLGARSGLPLYHEGKGKKAVSSSVMPQKRNPNKLERIQGMADMAESFADMIAKTVKTWEFRSIEMSSLERNAWPDLLHVVVFALRDMTRIINKLEVLPDNMAKILILSGDTWAASRANVFLRKYLAQKGKRGLKSDHIYRIVQLASYISDEPSQAAKNMREELPASLSESCRQIRNLRKQGMATPPSIKSIIETGGLKPMPNVLDFSEDEINDWNKRLRELFAKHEIISEWDTVFSMDDALQKIDIIYETVIGAPAPGCLA